MLLLIILCLAGEQVNIWVEMFILLFIRKIQGSDLLTSNLDLCFVWFSSVGSQIVEVFTKSLDFVIKTAVYVRNVITANGKVFVRTCLCVYMYGTAICIRK